MKKIIISMMAVAALAACTKSEVAYEDAKEIAFAPVTKNITKAAMTGTYPTDLRLGVYANYGSVNAETTVNDGNVASFSTAFLNDATFTHKTVGSISAWGCGETWPTNGSLIFAGYSMPAEGTVGTSRSYNFSTDVLTIDGYTQSTSTASTFDLCWFGRTTESYNYRNTVDAVDVTLSHALAWIEIRAYGEGTTIAGDNPWTITSIVMNNVSNTGKVSCTGSGAGKATWTSLGSATNDITIFSGSKALTGTTTVYENTTAGTLVIPQNPTAVDATNPGTADTEVATLTVKYTYKSPAGTPMPEQTSTVSLAVTDGWKSGYKYVYTLKFKANEILVAPSYGEWADVGDMNIDVE